MHIYIVRVFVSDMALIKISQMGLHWMGGNVHANKAVLCIASGCALSVNLSLSGPSSPARTDLCLNHVPHLPMAVASQPASLPHSASSLIPSSPLHRIHS